MKKKIALGIVSIILLFLVIATGCCKSLENDQENIPPEFNENAWLSQSQVLMPDSAEINRSVILIHGFVGSPFDLKPLAMRLHEKGFRVIAPVVPEQTDATPVMERGHYTPHDYIDWINDIVEKEKAVYGKPPFIVGFSMGGSLANIVAASGKVDKAVLIAPFFALPFANDFATTLSIYIGDFIPVIKKPSRGKINDPVGKSRYAPGSYRISLKAYLHLQELARLSRDQAQNSEIPLLIVVSENDEVASYKSIVNLFKDRDNCTIQNYPSSNHILLYDYNSVEIIDSIESFLLLE